MGDAILAQCGIYQIKNAVSGKVYVGQSVDIQRRRAHHFYLLNRGSHTCGYMQRSFSKHGEQHFEFSILELCEEPSLTEREQFWMDANRGAGLFNLAPAAGSNKGVKYSDEAKAKISASRMGNAARTGMKNTPEANARTAAARCGKPMSDDTKAKIGAIHAGRTLSAEHLAKMSAGLKGIPRTDVWRKRMSESMKGKRNSPEAIEKIRQANLGRKQSPELIARRIAAAVAGKAAKKAGRLAGQN